MGTEDFTPAQLARWSPDVRAHAEADERFYQALLAGRAVSALTYDEMRAICSGFAAIDPMTGKKALSKRQQDNRYRSAWERIRRAQTPETNREWDNEERRRAVAFTERAKALASHTPPTRKEEQAARFGKAPTQRHRKYNSAPGGSRRHA